jgi:hypothetical protein
VANGAGGNSATAMRVMMDNVVVDPNTAFQYTESHGSAFYNTPYMLRSAVITPGGNGTTPMVSPESINVAGPANPQSRAGKELAGLPSAGPAGSIPTRLNSPMRNLRDINEALTAAQDAVAPAVRSDMSSFGGIRDTMDQTLHNSLANTSAQIHVGLNLAEMMPVSLLLSNYPDLKVVFTPQIQTRQYDVAPQDGHGIHAQLSALISNVINATVGNFNLAEVAFCYSNYRQRGPLDPPGLWEFHRLSSSVPMNQAELRQVEGYFRQVLETDLWPVVAALGGAFDISCSFSLSSVTTVNLHLRDFHALNATFEYHHSLGGLTAPTIGMYGDVEHNAIMLENCVERVGRLIPGAAEAFGCSTPRPTGGGLPPPTMVLPPPTGWRR